VKLAPSLVPAAELAGRMLGESGELRRAARIVEKAWQDNPHPDLADTYAHLRPGDAARERLARVQTLALKTPGHIEGTLAVARAALDAQEFAVARAALEPLLQAPTQRVAVLMAALEQRESNNEGRAREWMARALRAPRDPAWTADGFVSDRWMPVSPVSGRLDAFQWKVPLAEWFAEAYAWCARYSKIESVASYAIYDYDPTPTQHRSTCSLIKRSARDDTPPKPPPAPPVVTGDPAPPAAPPVTPVVVPGNPARDPGPTVLESPAATATPTRTPSPTRTPASTPTPTATPTPTPDPTEEPTPAATPTAVATEEPSATPTATPEETATPTPEPTEEPTPTATPRRRG